MSSEKLLKVVMIGALGSGKTSLLHHFRNPESQFENSRQSTLGVEFATQDRTIEKQNVKLQIWDASGGEKYHSIKRAFYRGVSVFVVAIDLTDQNAIIATNELIKDLIEEEYKNIPVVLAGTKNDVENQVVSEEEIKEIQKTLKNKYRLEIPYIKTSVKNNINIEKLFMTGALMVLKLEGQVDQNDEEIKNFANFQRGGDLHIDEVHWNPFYESQYARKNDEWMVRVRRAYSSWVGSLGLMSEVKEKEHGFHFGVFDYLTAFIPFLVNQLFVFLWNFIRDEKNEYPGIGYGILKIFAGIAVVPVTIMHIPLIFARWTLSVLGTIATLPVTGIAALRNRDGSMTEKLEQLVNSDDVFPHTNIHLPKIETPQSQSSQTHTHKTDMQANSESTNRTEIPMPFLEHAEKNTPYHFN